MSIFLCNKKGIRLADKNEKRQNKELNVSRKNPKRSNKMNHFCFNLLFYQCSLLCESETSLERT